MYKLSPEELDRIIKNTIEDKTRLERLLAEGEIHGVRDLTGYIKDIAMDKRILKDLSQVAIENIKNIGKEDKQC